MGFYGGSVDIVSGGGDFIVFDGAAGEVVE